MEEHTEGHWEVLTTELLDKPVEPSTEKEEGKATEAESATWTLLKFAKMFQISQFQIYGIWPQMKRSIKATTHDHQRITIAAATQWVKVTTPITMFSQKLSAKPPSTISCGSPKSSTQTSNRGHCNVSMILLLMYSQKVYSSLKLCHNASLHHIGTIFISHHLWGT